LSVPKSEQFSESVTVSFEGQMVSRGRYPGIFTCQMEAIAFIFAKRAVLKTGEYLVT